MNSERKVVPIIIVAVTCAVLIAFWGIVFWWNADVDIAGKEILRQKSPDEKHVVVVEQIGSPGWPYGSVTSRITIKNIETGEEIKRFEEDVPNDGGSLYENQFTIQWSKDFVKIVIQPAESNDIEHMVMLK